MLSVESLPAYVKVTCAHMSSVVHAHLHQDLYKNQNYQSGFLVSVVFNHSHTCVHTHVHNCKMHFIKCTICSQFCMTKADIFLLSNYLFIKNLLHLNNKFIFPQNLSKSPVILTQMQLHNLLCPTSTIFTTNSRGVSRFPLMCSACSPHPGFTLNYSMFTYHCPLWLCIA